MAAVLFRLPAKLSVLLPTLVRILHPGQAVDEIPGLRFSTAPAAKPSALLSSSFGDRVFDRSR
jgi:hypothetical protein